VSVAYRPVHLKTLSNEVDPSHPRHASTEVLSRSIEAKVAVITGASQGIGARWFHASRRSQ